LGAKCRRLPDALQAKLAPWLERAERIRTQQPKDKGKLYALHAPEVECIGKGKARKPYEFGVKVSVAVTAKQGLMVGARAFPNNPYDGHTLAEQIEQTTILLQDVPGEPKPKTVLVDLGYRGVDHELAPVQVIHRGKAKSLTKTQRRWLKRRQAVEPAIGHAKHDHGLDRCYLKGAEGDALHAVLCAAGLQPPLAAAGDRPVGLKAAFLRRFLLSVLEKLLPRPANQGLWRLTGLPRWAEK
jgi:IS5 family transposase